jgi:hypothetical protein
MNFPPVTPLPGESKHMSRARRRRARRMLAPADAEGRAALLVSLSQRAYPSYEFFLLALLSGAILGAAYILNSQALLIFGILLAPLMTPWVGMTLATVTGSMRFFLQTLAALLVGGLLVFAGGFLAGWASRIWLPLTLNQAFLHSRLWWPDLIVLAIGAVLLTVSFVRSEEKPYLPSVILAYGLFLPLSAGAFGLGSGVGNIWPQGLLVFVAHLAWATLFGVGTLFVLHFRPLSVMGFAFGTSVVMAALILLFELTGLSRLVGKGITGVPASVPTQLVTSGANVPPIPKATSTPTFKTPTPAALLLRATTSRSATSVPTISFTTLTLPPSATLTVTLTPEPTPVYAHIQSEAGGVNLRNHPGGTLIITLENGTLVELLAGPERYQYGLWVQVNAIVDNVPYQGWIIQSALVTATSAPN